MIPSLTDPFVLVIVAALLISAGADVLVNLLTLRCLPPAPPQEFADVFDAEEYARSQEYTRAKVRFGLVDDIFSLLAILAFLLLGGLAWADAVARSVSDAAVLQGVVFMGLLALAGELLSLPFSVYQTFVLEERFGFNRATWKTFVLDRLKGWLLGAILGGALLAAVIWFFQVSGAHGWLYAWAAAVFFLLLLQYLAPTVLLPLFNTFSPLEEGELRQRIRDYMQRVDFALQGVYVIDGSRRSTKANAYFTGFGSKKRIALFDTLVQRHPQEEILAVLAHEVGHYKHRHVLKMIVVSVLKAGVLLWLLSLLLGAEALFVAFGLQSSVHAGLLLFGLLFTPLSLALAIPGNAATRRFERQADTFAVRTTGKSLPLAAALKRLAAHSLANLTPHRLEVLLHYSHPPVLERVRRLQAMDTEEAGQKQA